ncbi:hypothetical protein PHYBLDRAFT_68858 [Phycomyces blakesleeanus NRRL 1555(-)]|uniref:Uncharacterized protein n=1 Tax=Phycomyces blakesleeanus (strain ATCC 8743b / DSM 1359 / FGSC 10004 / NBRC 33097 / NRRL 1555) TaxID=763407 RepID=A0A163D2U2_PHYB8|nr:hypothetical protein PHYBLDRAFT_68858 [Phycomyces blakesleeanus NRRL 1555(-)]OAD68310.1 hypothetical protein PHYBLDRAFT_68858 [Phycomyces blakesleeanus NRRL 1555(-)]|eukprot:XP_018286350.1 hypothetical protein PHYBLDRAFT_68858 [Phycomyces blakesleeanus NRRL 1555(-)]
MEFKGGAGSTRGICEAAANTQWEGGINSIKEQRTERVSLSRDLVKNKKWRGVFFPYAWSTIISDGADNARCTRIVYRLNSRSYIRLRQWYTMCHDQLYTCVESNKNDGDMVLQHFWCADLTWDIEKSFLKPRFYFYMFYMEL